MTTLLTILFFVWFFRKTLKAHKKVEKGRKLSAFDKFLTTPCRGVLDPPEPEKYDIKLKIKINSN
jgi:hypothetical protein